MLKTTKFRAALIKKYFPNRVFNILFSGGIDSIAIAHFLKQDGRNQVILHHFNHGLAGDDEISKKCEIFARNFGFEICVRRNNSINTDRKSAEHFCRDSRYAAYSQFSLNFLVCHHLDDAVENYLVNCCAGHPEYKPIKEVLEMARAKFVRPFLFNKKQEFWDYAKAQHDLLGYVAYDEWSKTSRRHLLRQAIELLKEAGVSPYKAVKKIYEESGKKDRLLKYYARNTVLM